MNLDCAGTTDRRAAPPPLPRPRVYRDEEKRIPALFMDFDEGRIFYETPGPIRPDMLERSCVCTLDDGTRVARRVHPSAAGPDLYDLISLVGPTMVGVRILQAGLVIQVMTRGGAGRFLLTQLLNRNPTIPHDRPQVLR